MKKTRLIIVQQENSGRWLVCGKSDYHVYATFDTQAEAQAYWDKAQLNR